MPEDLAERMVRVRTSGAVRLTAADGADLTPRGRKARALILYLLRRPDHAATRRELTLLLWGDRGEEQARQSLRQTLYELRPLIDAGVLVADRLAVRLDRALLATTDDERSGSRPIAADLDGVSPQFDRWLRAEREGAGIGPVPLLAPAPPAAARPARRPGFAGAGPVLLAVAALLVLGSLALFHGWRAEARHRVIVVRPLSVAPRDPAADRLSQDLVSDLSRAVLGHDATLAFADARDAAPSTTAFTVGGRVATIGGELHAIVTISDGADPAILWSHDYAAPADDVAAMRQQVSTNVAAALVCALGARGMPDRIDRQATALYLEVCNLHSGDQAQEVYLARQVTERAPRFAGGWSALAIGLAFTSRDAAAAAAGAMRREAEAAASRALALDPGDGNAYYARALLIPGLADWIARERLVAAGLAAEPDNPQLHNLHAHDLTDIGRQAEGLAAFDRSVALDPLYPGKTAALVRALANAGELDRAREEVAHMRAIWPDSGYTWHAGFVTAARIGDPREAEAMLAHAGDNMSPGEVAAWRSFLEARIAPSPHNVAAAIASLEARHRADGGIDAQLVSDLTLLGRPDSALALALRMPPQEDHDFWFRSILKPLRADPRFMTVADRQGLLRIWRATNRWPDFCRDGSVAYDCRRMAVPPGAAGPRGPLAGIALPVSAHRA